MQAKIASYDIVQALMGAYPRHYGNFIMMMEAEWGKQTIRATLPPHFLIRRLTKKEETKLDNEATIYRVFTKQIARQID